MTPSRLPTVMLFAVLLALGACGTKNPDDSKVLVTVNGEPITEKYYDNYLRARMQQPMPLPGDEKERRQMLLDEMVHLMLLAQGAVDQKADQETDVYLQMKYMRENLLARAMLRKHFRDQPITDQEIEKRIIKNEFRVRHILVKTEAEANDLLAELNKGTSFAALAKSRSLDTKSGKQGGNLNWVSQEDPIVPQFFEAVATLKKGETSPKPVKTFFGWHVIHVDDVRPHTSRQPDKLASEIRAQIQQERVEALANALKDKAKIQYSE